MKKERFSIQKPDFLIPILWAGAILVNIKSIFSDYDVDLSYAIATSYRHLAGDTMFGTMWEPHQTSAFLADLLMLVYRRLTGGYTGVVIYLNICGVIMYALTALFLTKTLKQYTDNVSANLIGCIFFAFRVRQIVMPEFTNMLVCFSVLLILFLIKHLEKPEENIYLALASISLCLAVLSYPSAIILYIPVILILAKYSDRKIKDIAIPTLICLIIGIVYISVFIYKLGGTAELISSLQRIFLGDSYHTDRHENGLLFYTKEMIEGILWISASAIIAYIIDRITRLITGTKAPKTFLPAFGFFLILIDLIINAFFKDIAGPGGRYVYGTIFIPIVILAFKGLKQCNESEKKIWNTSALITAFICLSVILLTNMELITVVQYLIPLAVISYIPAKRLLDNSQKESGKINYPVFLLIIPIMIIMHRGILIRDYSGAGTSILNIESIVKQGPAKGVVCSYMSAYMTKCNDEDWDMYVGSQDRLLVVSRELNDSLLYMLNESEISHYSTIDTPTYNETLLEYWEMHPDKKPTVIALECWYSDMHISEESWIYNWTVENYTPIGEGRYWRFYRIAE